MRVQCWDVVFPLTPHATPTVIFCLRCLRTAHKAAAGQLRQRIDLGWDDFRFVSVIRDWDRSRQRLVEAPYSGDPDQ
jgi:hypothetical protein